MLKRGIAYTTIISSKDHGTHPASHLASPLPNTPTHKLATKTEKTRSHRHGITANGSERSLRPKPLLEPSTLDRTRRSSSLRKGLFNDRICGLQQTWRAAHPSRRWLHGKTLLRLCKANPQTQTLSTGWDELQRHASSPKQRRRPLAIRQMDTPRIQKNYRALFTNIARTEPTKSHTHGIVPPPANGSCGPQTQGQPVKVIGRKGISRLQSNNNI